MTSRDTHEHKPWAGLGTLLLVTFAVAAVDSLTFRAHAGPMGTLGVAVETSFIAIPAVSASAVIMLKMTGSRTALAVAAGAMLVMLALDAVPSAGVPRGQELILRSDGQAARKDPPQRWTASGAVFTVARCARSGCLGSSPGPITVGSVHFSERLAVFKAFFLLAPFVVVGFCRWLYLWARHSLLFMSGTARVVIDLLLTWIAPLVVLAVILTFTEQAMIAMLADGAGAVVLAQVYLPLLTIAGLGWLFVPNRNGDAS